MEKLQPGRPPANEYEPAILFLKIVVIIEAYIYAHIYLIPLIAERWMAIWL